MSPIIIPDYVYYNMTFTEQLHSKPLTQILLRSFIQLVPCNCAVILLIRRGPLLKRIVHLFIDLVLYQCALHVL